MFWADRIAEEIVKARGKGAPLVIRDEKTVSGRVHVGSMRGVAIHGAVHEALNKLGVENVFRYELNDFDPMDDIPAYLDQEVYKEHLGKQLKNIPSPVPGFASFAEYFGDEFRKVIEGAGWHPEFYWGSSLYESGKMDGAIRLALEHAQDIVRIYKEVSGSQRTDEWLPINVVCPQCAKVTTTEASNFDGETVEVHCRVDKAPYTRGCDFRGRVSPFGGKAKLAWKVEWPAKWLVNGVAVEGAGKDHSTKGGSRDVGNHISKEVFSYEPPFDVPYEFFLIGGRKMSSSKGRGSSAGDIAALVPAKIFRLALLGKDISQQMNFDPEGDTIPVLFDQYDKLVEAKKSGVEDNNSRLFEFLHVQGTLPEYLPRFSQVAFLVQMPHLNLEEEVEAMKGSPLTAEDRAELTERAEYAKRWLDEYAPEKFVFKLQDTLPAAAHSLSPVQKKALKTLHDFLVSSPTMPSGEDLHHFLHGLKESEPISPAELFSAVYRVFLNKSMGPKAGWFISVLPRDFVLKRLEEASA